MRLLRAKVTNFGSYRELEFDFTNQGLTLIQGPTGSGKSTLMDIATWCLFGETAKGGAVNEVRNWDNEGTPTTGTLTVETPTGIITVARIRGKPQENDLYYEETNSESKIRGKDITETQKSLERRLGIDYSIFVAGSYFNEFSSSAAFFTSKSKERRSLFEKIASLEFPLRIADGCKAQLKDCRDRANRNTNKLAQVEGTLGQIRKTLERAQKDGEEWAERREQRIQKFTEELTNIKSSTEAKAAELEAELFYIDSRIVNLEQDLKGQCPTCGAVRDKDTRTKIATLKTQHKALERELDSLPQLVKQVEQGLFWAKEETENPHLAQVKQMTAEEATAQEDVEILTLSLEQLNARASSLTQLYDLSFDLRGELLKQTVSQVEQAANKVLESHFDAPLRLEFSLEGSDDLIVGIRINGKECVYTQLSKGQRQLLKLSFAVAVMQAVSNQSGVHFSQLMFDEALDGLDGELKVKAISLFEFLSNQHESVFLIDHSQELQAMVPHSYTVSIENGMSILSEQS